MEERVLHAQRGGILLMTLVFVVMFGVIFLSLSGATSRQYHESTLLAHDEVAFGVAEAGLNYARWRLSHDVDNFVSEQKEVSDQFAGVIGTYTITFTAPDPGSTVILISSVGVTSATPSREVTLEARYGIPSLARFAMVVNEDVWLGGGAVKGATHSNGGIRMDSTSDSLVTSAQETYICQPYHGCNNVEKPGVWGTGGNQELWQYPVPAVDYNAMTLDLLEMKSIAETNGTYYGPGGNKGYHVVFNSNSTYTLYRVTKLESNRWSYYPEDGWQYTSHDINKQSLIGTYAVPANGILFFEDTLWVDGEIRDRVTVAAGKFPDNPSTNVDIIINGNITYGGVHDGTRSLGAIAQRHVLLPYSGIPDVLTLEGAYIAQKGRFGRRHYDSGPDRYKTSITQYGMTASNAIPVTTWVSGGSFASGFASGSSEYDPSLLYGPPPYFPTTGSYQFISWERVE